MQTTAHVLRAVTALSLYAALTPAAPLPPATAPGTLQQADLALAPLAATRIGLGRTPTLELDPVPMPSETNGPWHMRHVVPDIPQPFDPEELLANEAISPIDPDTGEAVPLKPGLAARRDRGDPY